MLRARCIGLNMYALAAPHLMTALGRVMGMLAARAEKCLNDSFVRKEKHVLNKRILRLEKFEREILAPSNSIISQRPEHSQAGEQENLHFKSQRGGCLHLCLSISMFCHRLIGKNTKPSPDKHKKNIQGLLSRFVAHGGSMQDNGLAARAKSVTLEWLEMADLQL